MRDLILKAANLTSMQAKLHSISKRLTNEIGDQFIEATHDHSLHVFTPLVVTPGVYNEDGNELTPPVLDNNVFALLRCTEEVAASVEAIPGAPAFVLTGAEADLVASRIQWAS